LLAHTLGPKLGPTLGPKYALTRAATTKSNPKIQKSDSVTRAMAQLWAQSMR